VGNGTGSLRIAPDFSFAETASGERIEFTRSEKRVLAALAQRPNRIQSRDQLLEAVAGTESDALERNIDFLINRLRRKLSDNARNPRFIATRYGEGYAWIGRTSGIAASYADAYLVVGPFKGIDNLGCHRASAERFASHLHGTLRSELPPERRVVLAPDCPPAADFADTMPTLSVELAFFEECGAVHCIVTARQFRSGRMLAVQRVVVPEDEPAEAIRSAAKVAKLLLAEAWRTLATQTADGVPLPVLMHLASTRPEHSPGASADSDRDLQKLLALHESRTMAAWKENEARLKRLLMESPDDAFLKIMHAAQIHSKYIMFGHNLFHNGVDDRTRDEDDIEALTLEALPHIRSQPEYAIMAAKLLHFLQRGYFDLARELSEEAYASSVSAAGSLTMIGQFRAYAGETEAALRCIDQALNLVTPGSKAHFYTLTVKLQTLRAVSDYERLKETKRQLYRMSTVLMVLYEPLFANPDELSLRAKAVIMALSRKRAAAMLQWTNYVSSRLFSDPAHRTNDILALLTLVVRRFGKAAVPDEIKTTHPGVLDRFA